MDRATRTCITGTGAYAPARVLTNQDLEKIVDTTDAWIVERTGIRERRITSDDEAASDLAYEASVRALADAHIEGADLDAILVATVSSDYGFPSTACLLQHRLGATHAFAYDFSAACSGFIFGIGQAQAFLQSGMCRRILVIGVETLTKLTNWTDRNTCVLFGDGAGAAVLETRTGEAGLLSVLLQSDGGQSDIIMLPAGGSRRPLTAELIEQHQDKIHMKGNEVFKVAVRNMEAALLQAIADAGIRQEDIDLLIPHQANIRIIQSLGKRLSVPEEKVFINVDRFGNTSAATIPMAIDEARRTGRLGPGSILAIAAFGSGITWGAAVIRL